MSKERLFEIVSVILLVVFVFVLVSQNFQTKKSADEIWETVSTNINIDDLQEKSSADFAREFELSEDDFDGVVYYGTNTVMNVKEVLILKLKDSTMKEDVEDALTSRVDEKCDLFEKYAPDQYDLLKNYILEEKGGIIFYAVTDDTAAALAAFEKAV